MTASDSAWSTEVEPGWVPARTTEEDLVARVRESGLMVDYRNPAAKGNGHSGESDTG